MNRLTLLLCMLFLPAQAALTADLPAWMAGSWGQTADGITMEEHWTSPGAGMMLGIHRDVPLHEGEGEFEFLRIVKRPDGIFYVASPSGRPPVEFKLISSTADRVVFSNPEHDFPQRIIYWRTRDDLCARIEGKPTATEKAMEWCWAPRGFLP